MTEPLKEGYVRKGGRNSVPDDFARPEPPPPFKPKSDWESMWAKPFHRPDLLSEKNPDGNTLSVGPELFGAILADPPWSFQTFSGPAVPARGEQPYKTMATEDLIAMPVQSVAAPDAVLFLWITWPMLLDGLEVIRAWGFKYKTCAFAWMKADGTQLNMFPEHYSVRAGMGYWTMANSEVCLLATRGQPKRLNADVRQGIIEPRREHSRKPDCVHGRIERLVPGPYLELFARQERPNWTAWGNEVNKFNGNVPRPAGPPRANV
jgi:N6-adenosine-specific RNA methylase IME4